jgi:hypothetical protein
MPDRIRGEKLTDLGELKRLEDARLDGIECYRVQGQVVVTPEEKERRHREAIERTGEAPEEVEQGPQTLWVEKGSFLLRRIEQQDRFSTFRTDDVTTYEPRVGVRITEDQLRFDPPAETDA